MLPLSPGLTAGRHLNKPTSHGVLGLLAGPQCLLSPLGSVIRAVGCIAFNCSTRLAPYIGHDGPAVADSTATCRYEAVCAMRLRISSQEMLHQCGTIMTVVDWCSAALGERCRTLRGVCCARLAAHSLCTLDEKVAVGATQSRKTTVLLCVECVILCQPLKPTSSPPYGM